MKNRPWFILLGLLLCLFIAPCPAKADAFETLPAEVQQLFLSQYSQEDVADTLTFSLANGQTCCMILNHFGWLYGYFTQGDGYVLNYCNSNLANVGTESLQLVRHTSSGLQPDGSAYTKTPGFDIWNGEGCRMSFCFSEGDQGFDFVGYRGEHSAYDVMVSPGGDEMVQLAFYRDGQLDSRFRVYDSLFRMPDLTELPAQPEQARLLETVSPERLAARQEGYTLRWYSSDGVLEDTMVETAYSKVENGFLTVRWVHYQAGGSIQREFSSFPIPLSETFRRRLETEDFQQLIHLSGNSEFAVDDFWDASLLPVSGKVIQNLLQSKVLLLLTEEEDGTYHLTEITQKADGTYALRKTPALPSDVWLDTFHGGEEVLLLTWDQQNCNVCFQRTADGQWRLSWFSRIDEFQPFLLSFSLYRCSVWDKAGNTTVWKVGALPFDLFTDPLSDLSGSMEEWAGQIDPSGLAVVCNPDPADRLHLRTKPSREADSLGKFWNGTPVRVLDERDGWCQVEIGTDGRLIGWMMKKYLAFGSKMNSVTPCFSQQILREDVPQENMPLYTDLTLKETYCTHSAWTLMGVVDGRLYVIVTDEGETGYAPMEWFFDGNG